VLGHLLSFSGCANNTDEDGDGLYFSGGFSTKNFNHIQGR
jgi:hypothetical protein